MLPEQREPREPQRRRVPRTWQREPPERRQAECYQLGTDGRYRLRFGGEAGGYQSEVLPGFWLKVEWLWQEPLPPVLPVLRELGVI